MTTDAEQHRELLALHCKQLLKLLQWRACLGVQTPPDLLNHIDEHDAAIRRIKTYLRENDVSVGNELGEDMLQQPELTRSPQRVIDAISVTVDEAERVRDMRPPACPYPGMVPFTLSDRDCFFGRGELIQEIMAELADTERPLLGITGLGGIGKTQLASEFARRYGETSNEPSRALLILGASGSGKSSLVQAGLLPSLERHYHHPFNPEEYTVNSPLSLDGMVAGVKGESKSASWFPGNGGNPVSAHLADWLSQKRLIDEPYDLGRAEEIYGALTYLHSRPSPTVHADIKPSNILLTREGDLRLLDFETPERGRICGDAPQSDEPITYFPHEQWGQRGIWADHHRDVYSFGAILYDLLTGQISRPSAPLDGLKEPVVPSLLLLLDGLDEVAGRNETGTSVTAAAGHRICLPFLTETVLPFSEYVWGLLLERCRLIGSAAVQLSRKLLAATASKKRFGFSQVLSIKAEGNESVADVRNDVGIKRGTLSDDKPEPPGGGNGDDGDEPPIDVEFFDDDRLTTIDGFVVVDRRRAFITLKSTLSDRDKQRGIRIMVKYARANSDMGVYYWKVAATGGIAETDHIPHSDNAHDINH